MSHSLEDHTWKQKLKKRFKVLLVMITLLISVALVFSAYTGSTNMLTSAFSSNLLGNDKGPMFAVTGEFVLPPLQLDASQTSLDIHFKEGSGALFIQDLQVSNLKTSTISLVGFKGKIMVEEGGILQLKGEATTVTLNEGDITKNKKTVKVNFQNLGIEDVTFSWIVLRSLTFASTGKIDVKGRGSFDITGEKAEITPFRGNMKMSEGQLSLEGEARNIELEKNPRVVVSFK